jgi:hypothetical protein
MTSQISQTGLEQIRLGQIRLSNIRTPPKYRRTGLEKAAAPQILVEQAREGHGFSRAAKNPRMMRASAPEGIAHYNANRFKNENQFEINVNLPSTSNTPNAINSPPLATSKACMCERKRL